LEKYLTEHRVGGIIYRKTGGQIEYLLVTSKLNPARWIFSSGHIEEGETYEEMLYVKYWKKPVSKLK
jgi:hypothetical protein